MQTLSQSQSKRQHQALTLEPDLTLGLNLLSAM